VLTIAGSVAMVVAVAGLGRMRRPQPGTSLDPDIIVTAAPVYDALAALKAESAFEGRAVVLVHAGKAERAGNGCGKRGRECWFRRKTVLFAGKQTPADKCRYGTDTVRWFSAQADRG